MARLLKDYKERVIGEMISRFNYKNKMMVPRLEKICVNMGVGKAIENEKFLDDALREMTTICGQKPVVTKARKSVAQFKIRTGYKVGCCVTLRGKRMYEFFDRLVNVAMPRIRDFRGLSPKSFDGRGNYTLGIAEQNIFPEIDPDKIAAPQGMDIVLVTTAKTNEEAFELLKRMGMPFRDKR